jgi:hypothetical protein
MLTLFDSGGFLIFAYESQEDMNSLMDEFFTSMVDMGEPKDGDLYIFVGLTEGQGILATLHTQLDI